MLKTEQLALYLDRYIALPVHTDHTLKQMTLAVMVWQKQRLTAIHPNIFSNPQFTAMQDFFFNYFYDFETLELLAEQLQQALNEKIKLDRWLPNEILDTLLNGFQLALLTLETDSNLAALLLKQNLPLSSENILTILPQARQMQERQQQLELLLLVSTKLLKFSQSFLIRSALKFAKPRIEQRGFSKLNQYIEDSLQVMRAHKNQHFFKLLTDQEKIFLDYLGHHQPVHLNLYYDVKIQNIRAIP